MEKKKNITLIVIAMLALLVLAFGVSYAFFISRVNLEGTGSNVGGSAATVGDTVVTTTGSIGFGDLNIYPGHKNVSKVIVKATGEEHVIYNLVWSGINTLNTTLNYTVYKTTTNETPSITCTKREEGTTRKELYEECVENNFSNLGEPVSSGEIKEAETNTTVKLIKNEEIDATTTGTTVYYYIVLEYPNKDEGQNIQGTNATFTGNINVQILDRKELTASEYLIAKNEMVHETFTNDDGQLVDTGYRYEGSSPKNYVRFNNNELWRIIGVFEVENADTHQAESLVKIIRYESIGYIIWDSSNSNDWTESDLKTILNGQYYNGEDINYAYRNTSKGAIAIAGKSINDTARAMIQSVKWNIGGTEYGTASEYYTAERGNIGAGSNPTATTWPGYIGLMYPSDYGYAVDSASCSRTTTLIEYYNPGLCSGNNWLYKDSERQWTLTPFSSNRSNALLVNGIGDVNTFVVGSTTGLYAYVARPSLYLKSNVSIVDNGKDGSYDHPYNLELN